MKKIKEFKDFMQAEVKQVSGADKFYKSNYSYLTVADSYEDAIVKFTQVTDELIHSCDRVQNTFIVSDYPQVSLFEFYAKFIEENDGCCFRVIAKDEAEVKSLCKWLQKQTGALIYNIKECAHFQIM